MFACLSSLGLWADVQHAQAESQVVGLVCVQYGRLVSRSWQSVVRSSHAVCCEVFTGEGFGLSPMRCGVVGGGHGRG